MRRMRTSPCGHAASSPFFTRQTRLAYQFGDLYLCQGITSKAAEQYQHALLLNPADPKTGKRGSKRYGSWKKHT